MTMTGTMMGGLVPADGAVLGWAIGVALKVSLLVVLAGALTLALGRRSAALRHLLWALAIGGVLMLPVIPAAIPWSWDVLPSVQAPTVDPTAESATARAPAGDVAAGYLPGSPRTSARPEAARASSPAPSGAPAMPEGDSRSRGWLAAAAWGAGALLLTLHHLAGRLSLARITGRASPVREPRLLHELERIVRAAGVQRQVRLLRSERIGVPMTWGVRQPVVLLPSDSRGWSAERIQLVLQHEMAHVRRMDASTDALARVACAIHWFNPLVWWAAARLRAESERASDDSVLQSGARASEYAGHLLDLVTRLGPGAAPAGALPLAQRSQFEGRLLAILDPARERSSVRRGSACALCAGLLGTVVLLASVAPAGAAATDADNAAPLAAPALLPTSSSVGTELSVADDEEPAAPPARVESPEEGTERGSAGHGVRGGRGDHETSGDALEAVPAGLAGAQALDTASVQALARALRQDADAEVRRTAAWALGQIEDRAATPALVEALRGDASGEVRRTAAWALGQVEDPAAAEALGDALADEDAEVRRTVLWALGQIESPAAVEPLSRALRDPDVEVRRTAAWALGQIESRQAVEPLAAAITDEDAGVREQVAWALGQIESAEAVRPLVRALGDAESEVRRQAAWALGQIESAAAVDALSTTLRSDEDVGVRRQAAWALGQIEADEAVPVLTAALSDTDDEVSRTAAWAIGQIEPAAAPPELIELARTGAGELRARALWALARIEDPAAVPALVDALQDEDPEVRTRALHGLAEIRDGAALRAIAELLQDPDPAVRAAAARALAGGASRWDTSPNPNPNPNPQPRPRPRPNGQADALTGAQPLSGGG